MDQSRCWGVELARRRFAPDRVQTLVSFIESKQEEFFPGELQRGNPRIDPR
jgi:hypothetical protein